MTWLLYSLVTAFCWGLYGVLLHIGQLGMSDPVNGRYKAFLLVGFAYFLTAVVGPIIIILKSGGDFSMTPKGIGWSLSAGIVGSLGALFVLLAFGAKGMPGSVMSIIFAGAPIINALFAIIMHPPHGGVKALPIPFLVGIVLAATGGFLVTKYKPNSAPPKKIEPTSSEHIVK